QRITLFRDRLAALCREAGCQQPEELSIAEESSRRRTRLEEELRITEKQLAEFARHESFDVFVAAATAMDADQLEDELARLHEKIDEKVKEKEQAIEAARDEHNWLQQHDGSAVAA